MSVITRPTARPRPTMKRLQAAFRTLSLGLGGLTTDPIAPVFNSAVFGANCHFV